MITLIDYEENNAYTISVSKIKDPVEIKVGVVEEDANCKIDVVLFPEEPRILKNYEIRIRIDERKIPYGQALVEAEKYLFATNEIVICHANNNEISENEIHNIGYSGISAGFVWGYGKSNTYGNIIRKNWNVIL